LPFTPLHLGPALALGLPLKRYIHVPTFVLASVLIDIEPLLVLVLDLDYPLHGYLHTLLFASLFGLALGYAMYMLERFFSPLYRALLLVPGNPMKIRSFVAAGASGAVIHVLLDAPPLPRYSAFLSRSSKPPLQPRGSGNDIRSLPLCGPPRRSILYLPAAVKSPRIVEEGRRPLDPGRPDRELRGYSSGSATTAVP